jgi:citronellol/citronellal dehydrogenase
MAKFNMSLCVLGMSAEFAKDGIAVNALWPRTTIATAAVNNLLGGDTLMRMSRKPDILADAAHLILTQSAKSFTGRFCIDDTLLYEVGGVRDFEPYHLDPTQPLALDFFVPDDVAPPPGVTVVAGRQR